MTSLNQGDYEAAAGMLAKSGGAPIQQSLADLCASQKLSCGRPVVIVDRGPAADGGRGFWVELEGSTPSRINLVEIKAVKNGDIWAVDKS